MLLSTGWCRAGSLCFSNEEIMGGFIYWLDHLISVTNCSNLILLNSWAQLIGMVSHQSCYASVNINLEYHHLLPLTASKLGRKFLLNLKEISTYIKHSVRPSVTIEIHVYNSILTRFEGAHRAHLKYKILFLTKNSLAPVNSIKSSAFLNLSFDILKYQ